MKYLLIILSLMLYACGSEESGSESDELKVTEVNFIGDSPYSKPVNAKESWTQELYDKRINDCAQNAYVDSAKLISLVKAEYACGCVAQIVSTRYDYDYYYMNRQTIREDLDKEEVPTQCYNLASEKAKGKENTYADFKEGWTEDAYKGILKHCLKEGNEGLEVDTIQNSRYCECIVGKTASDYSLDSILTEEVDVKFRYETEGVYDKCVEESKKNYKRQKWPK